MYVRTDTITYVNKRWGHFALKNIDVFTCDECETEFTKSHKASHANASLTFCSKKCNKLTRSTGKLANQWKVTKLARYGVEYSSQVLGASQKMIQSRVANTGAACPSDKSSRSHQKFSTTMFQKHGVEFAQQSSIVREKSRATCVERFGVVSPFSKGSQFRDEEAASRGGKKGYRSLILKHGAAVMSKPEAALWEWLKDRYGAENVEQQRLVQHGEKSNQTWLVDFYVRTLDTYIELDGVFWHGLDKPYEQLLPQMQHVFDKDVAQSAWFKERGMKLVRITDKMFDHMKRSNNFDRLVELLGG